MDDLSFQKVYPKNFGPRQSPDVAEQPIPETLIQSHNKLNAALIRYRSRRPRFKMFNGKPIDKFDETDAQLVAVGDDIKASETPNFLVLISLLELLCNREEKDPETASRVFENVTKVLVANNMIPTWITEPECANARANVLNFVKRLFVNQPSKALSYAPHNSRRYTTEFEEIKQLGEGGFGSVYKAYNKLDHKSYAIKKIPIDDSAHAVTKSSESKCSNRTMPICMQPSRFHKVRKILRVKFTEDRSFTRCHSVFNEVRTLAALENPYIVRYHSAWIENFNHENGLSLQSNQISSNSRIKELSCSEDVDFEDSHSDGIVFAEGSHVESSRNTVSKASCELSNKLPLCVQNNGLQNLDKHVANIPQIISWSSSSSEEDLCRSILFIQMELCHKTLTEWLQERNSSNEIVNDAQNRTIFLGILQGVVCIHSEDVIHRDLKPDNIFLKDGTHAKIGDFGLATSKDQTTLKMNSSGTDYKLLSKGVGTYSYSSPEQQNGTKYDTKSDIYSLGLILYEMYHPFKTLMERNHLFKDLKKERKLSLFVSKEFPQKANLILAMTDLDPTKRPTAKELLAQEKPPSEDEIIKDYEKVVAQLREEVKHLRREIMDQKHHS